jgi:hypothetical protein
LFIRHILHPHLPAGAYGEYGAQFSLLREVIISNQTFEVLKPLTAFLKGERTMEKTLGIALCCLLLYLFTLNAAYAARVALPSTGQTISYAVGDDGAKLKGVAWPTPRFIDNGDGTVTDNLTGLIWLKTAGCSNTVGGITKGTAPTTTNLTWANAIAWSNALASPYCGLHDGSTPGQWRLPNRNELLSLVDISNSYPIPPLPTGHPFTNVVRGSYWSASTDSLFPASAVYVDMIRGECSKSAKSGSLFVLPVRSEQ